MKIISDKNLEWLFKHIYHPVRQDEKGRYWIGQIGPYKTISQVVSAAIAYEKRQAKEK